MAALPCRWRQGYGMSQAAALAAVLQADHRRSPRGDQPFAQ